MQVHCIVGTHPRLMRAGTMLRFDAGVCLLKRHAAGRPLVLQRRPVCPQVRAGVSARCSGDAGQRVASSGFRGAVDGVTPDGVTAFDIFVEIYRVVIGR